MLICKICGNDTFVAEMVTKVIFSPAKATIRNLMGNEVSNESFVNLTCTNCGAENEIEDVFPHICTECGKTYYKSHVCDL